LGQSFYFDASDLNMLKLLHCISSYNIDHFRLDSIERDHNLSRSSIVSMFTEPNTLQNQNAQH